MESPGSPTALPGTAIDALETLMRSRHSCRAFLPEAVEEAVIGRILAVAQLTPSWCNAQPWKVIVTRSAATEAFREGLLAHVRARRPEPDIAFPREYEGAYRDRRRVCGFQLYDAVGVTRGDREASGRQAAENFRLFGAPHVAIITTETVLGTYGAVDCGAYVTTFMLAAKALGVASIAQAALASHAPFLRAHFGIPGSRDILCGISFGYEDEAHPANSFRTERALLEEIVEWRR